MAALVNAERLLLQERVLDRASAIRELGDALTRVAALLREDLPAEAMAVRPSIVSLHWEAQRAYENYLWDERGIFSEADVILSLASARAQERVLAQTLKRRARD